MRRLLVSTSLVAAMVAAPLMVPSQAGAQDAQGKITQYPAAPKTVPDTPIEFISGPGDSMWYTSDAGVSFFDPTATPETLTINRLTGAPAASDRGLVSDGSNAIYYISNSGRALVRVDKSGSSSSLAGVVNATNATVQSFSNLFNPVLQNGSLFVLDVIPGTTTTAQRNLLVRIDDANAFRPQGQVVTLPFTSVHAMVAGPDGNIWISGRPTTAPGSQAIAFNTNLTQVGTPVTLITNSTNEFTPMIPNAKKKTIEAFPADGRMITIDTATRRTTASTLPFVPDNAVASSKDGRVWVLNSRANQVASADGSTTKTFDLPIASQAGSALGEDAQGNMWVSLGGLKRFAKIGTSAAATPAAPVAAPPAAAAGGATTTTTQKPPTAAAPVAASNQCSFKDPNNGSIIVGVKGGTITDSRGATYSIDNDCKPTQVGSLPASPAAGAPPAAPPAAAQAADTNSVCSFIDAGNRSTKLAVKGGTFIDSRGVTYKVDNNCQLTQVSAVIAPAPPAAAQPAAAAPPAAAPPAAAPGPAADCDFPGDPGLGGRVFLDANKNKSFDAGETGIAGIKLLVKGSSKTKVGKKTVTKSKSFNVISASDGCWFQPLDPGTWSVKLNKGSYRNSTPITKSKIAISADDFETIFDVGLYR